MYFAYSLLTLVVFVVISPYFVYQAIRYKKYIGSLRQRLGFLPISFNIDGDDSIWIHAVSVGEVLTARAIAADLKTRYPRLRLFLSTTTIAGQQVARRHIQHADGVFYFPFDWTLTSRRTLNLVRPRLFLMMETEIWPNLLRLCRKRGVKTVVINGRISQRSYPRYRIVRPFFRRVLADVDRFCMQSEESARRLISLGADASRVTVSGSLKFDSLQRPSSTRARPGDRGVRRRQPRRSWRPQHSRAGRFRQADRVRAAHAELQGDCRRVPVQRRGHPGAVRSRARHGARRAGHRPGPARAARRGGARAGRSQSRREREDTRRHRRAPARAWRRLRGPSLPTGSLIGAFSAVYRAAAAWRRRWYARDASRPHRLMRPVLNLWHLPDCG